MKHTFLIILISVILFSCKETEKVDLIVHNAVVYTVNESFDVADAFVVNDGKIIEVGAENDIKNHYLAKEYIDAQKRPVYPGFIDAHCHFVGYSKGLQQINLKGTSSYEEVVNEIVAFDKVNQVEWITGRGWDQNDWEVQEFPNKEKLDELFPTKPVFVKRIDGHAALANQAALNAAKITSRTAIDGGIIEKQNDILTGILIDNAVDLVESIIPEPSNEELTQALLKGEQNLFEVGLTTVDDAGLDRNQIELIDGLQKSKKLEIKVYAMVSSEEELLEYYLEKGPIKTEKLNVRSFKFYADGALGSRGAHLIHPYSDVHHKDHLGLMIHPKEFYEKYAQQLYDKGFQMNTHCIGDSANRMMLSIYKNVLGGTNDKRWRIEHAQVIDSSDFNEFANYNIIPSVQPTHATSDMYWAEERLGEKRVKNAYAYKTLLQQNGLVALGTDFPIEGISPINTFYAAVARKDMKGYPDNGYQKENALSRKEALKGITIWAAISNFEEKEKGSIEVGKSADFVILSNDIMKTTEETILGTKVLGTYINGKSVYNVK